MRASLRPLILILGGVGCLLVMPGCSSGGGEGSSSTDVAGSAECDAYCEKENALGCGITCRPSSACRIAAGSCAAATRALLDCKVKTGSWSCLKDSSTPGVLISYSCGDYKSLCESAGDAGADTSHD